MTILAGVSGATAVVRGSATVGRGQPVEEHAHAPDLGGLIGLDICGEDEQLGFLAGAGLSEEITDHNEGAVVVLDHQLEEEPVEGAAGGAGERVELLLGKHAGHQLAVTHGGVHVGVRRRHLLVAGAEPALHLRDLVLLGDGDAFGEEEHLGAAGAVGHELGHDERLCVVSDHVLHEADIGEGVAIADAAVLVGAGVRDVVTAAGCGGGCGGTRRGGAGGREQRRGRDGESFPGSCHDGRNVPKCGPERKSGESRTRRARGLLQEHRQEVGGGAIMERCAGGTRAAGGMSVVTEPAKRQETERQFIRHNADVPLEVRVVTGERRRTHGLNVSLGGLSFVSVEPIAVGSAIEVRITEVDPPFEARGRVVWTRREPGGYSIGVQFLDPADVFRARMVEQVCSIERYRREVEAREGRVLTREEAAREWIRRYASRFPGD